MDGTKEGVPLLPQQHLLNTSSTLGSPGGSLNRTEAGTDKPRPHGTYSLAQPIQTAVNKITVVSTPSINIWGLRRLTLEGHGGFREKLPVITWENTGTQCLPLSKFTEFKHLKAHRLIHPERGCERTTGNIYQEGVW